MDTIVFRTLGAWGAGKGANLLPSEIDSNFWSLVQAIVDLQNDPALPVGIASISVAGTQMTITLTDGTVLGPYTLPVLTFRWRDEWTPTTLYAVLDVFTVTSVGIFMVQIAHTSGATFDPALTIGGQPALLQLFGSTDVIIAAIADHQVMANLSGGTAVATGHTLSDILDYDVGSAQGTLLYRSGTGWVSLAPGTAGQVLTTGGASANPAWAAGGGGAVPPLAADPGLGLTGTYLGTTGSSIEGVENPDTPGGAAGYWGEAGSSGNVVLYGTPPNGGGPYIAFASYNNTVADPHPTLAGDPIGTQFYYGMASGSPPAFWVPALGGGAIVCEATEDWIGNTAHGARLIFSVIQKGTGSTYNDMTFGPGLTVGAPTAPAGGDLPGDVNAGRVLVNGVPISSGASLPSGTAGDQLVYVSGAWTAQRPRYIIGAFAPGLLTASQIILDHRVTKAITIPANFGAYLGHTSQARGSANATGSTAIDVQKALSASPGSFASVGTITIAAGAMVGTFASSGGAAVSFAQGDTLALVGPATPDATFAGFAATLVGYET